MELNIKTKESECIQDQQGNILQISEGIFVFDTTRRLLKPGKNYRISIDVLHIPEESEVSEDSNIQEDVILKERHGKIKQEDLEGDIEC